MLDFLMSILGDYPSLVLFIGSIFPGEEIVLFFAFLAGQGVISIEKVFVLALLGLMCSDFIWFCIARSSLFQSLRKHTILSEDRPLAKLIVNRVGLKSYPLLLLITKFVYGTRVIAIILLSLNKTKVRSFLFFDFLALLIWSAVMIPIAWLAGKGISVYFNVAKDLQIVLLIVIILFLVVYLFNKLIVSRIVKRLILNKQR